MKIAGRLPFRLGVALVAVCAGWSVRAAQAQLYCDPILLKQVESSPIQSSPDRYTDRRGHCEGLYGGRGVSGDGTLLIISLTNVFDRFDPHTISRLRLQWPPVGTPVHIRAYAARPRFYYRMDTVKPAGTVSWDWPSPFFSKFSLTRADLGITATTIMRVGAADREVRVPLQVRDPAASIAAPSSRYRIVILPSADLIEVYLTIGPRRPRRAGAPLHQARRTPETGAVSCGASCLDTVRGTGREGSLPFQGWCIHCDRWSYNNVVLCVEAIECSRFRLRQNTSKQLRQLIRADLEAAGREASAGQVAPELWARLTQRSKLLELVESQPLRGQSGRRGAAPYPAHRRQCSAVYAGALHRIGGQPFKYPRSN